MAVPTFHALYAAGFFRAASPSSSPLPWPSSVDPGLGSQLASFGEVSYDAAGFASCCGPLACAFPAGRLDPALRRPGLPKRRRAATKVTWFLLRPDSHRLVIVNFRTHDPPSTLWVAQRSARPGWFTGTWLAYARALSSPQSPQLPTARDDHVHEMCARATSTRPPPSVRSPDSRPRTNADMQGQCPTDELCFYFVRSTRRPPGAEQRKFRPTQKQRKCSPRHKQRAHSTRRARISAEGEQRK